MPTDPARPREEEMLERLKRMADRAYCDFIDKMRTTECLGAASKLSGGTFTEENLKAHCKAYERYGAHVALSEAILLLSEHEGKVIERCAKICEGIDCVPVVNAATKWPDPPPMDERWAKAVCAAAERARSACAAALRSAGTGEKPEFERLYQNRPPPPEKCSYCEGTLERLPNRWRCETCMREWRDDGSIFVPKAEETEGGRSG